MERDDIFKNKIIAEEHYLEYSNEIIYYTGMCRNEHKLLNSIVDRMEKDYSGMKNCCSKTTVELMTSSMSIKV